MNIRTHKSVNCYGFEHDVANLMSYSHNASLQTMHIPSDAAKQNPRWKATMKELLLALQNNHTWELVSLPNKKRAMRCRTSPWENTAAR